MLGTKKLNEKQESGPAFDTDGTRSHSADTKKLTRSNGSALRAIGNLLIVVGVLMLLGIGGWYGYTTWSNAEYLKEVETKFGPQAVVEPGISLAPQPTSTPRPTPLPVLSSKTNIAQQMGTIVQAPDTSPPLRLNIPSVEIDQKVVPVGWSMIPAPGGGVKSEWDVADYAVGHHKGSANPGEIGNVVLSGHVDYKGEVFRNLHKVNKGDEVIMYTEKGQYIYVVVDLKIVREEGVSDEQKRANAAFMNPTEDRTLTMITCHPYGIDTHRLIVIAKPYESSTSTLSEFTLR